MKALVCELCNSNGLVKKDGFFVCEYCGTKYTVEEAKKMMIEGTVEVQGTVKIDTSAELANLYQLARRAKESNNAENAIKYFDMILLKEPNNWEANFYIAYFQALIHTSNVSQISSACLSLSNSVVDSLNLIKNNVEIPAEQKKAYTEIVNRTMHIGNMFFNIAQKYFDGLDAETRIKALQEYVNNFLGAVNCIYALGDGLVSVFPSDAEANKLAVSAWKQGVVWHNKVFKYLRDKNTNKYRINIYVTKIKKYEPNYAAPRSKGGCYVATAVYGSYECPEVWTLRRYRDNTLAVTWYGRVFIRVYYAISPALVKWFGHTEWFKKMWKSKLDRMVVELQSMGVESTPYEDKDW